MSQFGETPTEGGGYKFRGLTFTGAFLNGRLMIVSDQLPVKAKSGKKVHCFYMDEPDPLGGGEVFQTIVMSQDMYDAVMSDAMEERNKVESLSSN